MMSRSLVTARNNLMFSASHHKNKTVHRNLHFQSHISQNYLLNSKTWRKTKPLSGFLNINYGHMFTKRNVNTTLLRSKEQKHASETKTKEFCLPEAEIDMDYLCDLNNLDEIEQNIGNRKGVGDIKKVHEIKELLSSKYRLRDIATDIEYQTEAEVAEILKEELLKEAIGIPNKTHPDVPIGDENQARLLELVGEKKDFAFKPKTVVTLGERLDMLRTDNVGHTTGQKTYYLKGGLAQLERALIKYTVDKLKMKGFRFISVPDIIHPSIIEACGFQTSGERTQVYKLNPHLHGNLCLVGTAEMPLAGYFHNQELNFEKLPDKLVTMSRCYRAETADTEEESGIYRVHQFTKVEMFGVTANETGEESMHLMQMFMEIQKELFQEIGLHIRILDMPTQELGAPAYRKYDVETWMPAKKFWGEISSTSNCTDYQSRRLNIKYWTPKDDLRHVHTVNGTGCAVPRMIMAIVENFQKSDGSVAIPDVLQPYMKGIEELTPPDMPNKMRYMVLTKAYKKSQKHPRHDTFKQNVPG